MDGLLKQIGGLEQYVYLAPVHGARNATGQACRHEGRFLNSLQHLHHQVNIAAFLVVMHARAKQSDLNALAKHVLRRDLMVSIWAGVRRMEVLGWIPALAGMTKGSLQLHSYRSAAL